MRIIECDQGSPEWLQARAGVITASMFRVARSRVGGLTPQQQKLVDAIRNDGLDIKAAAEVAGYKSKPTMSETLERAIMGLPVGDWSDPAKNYAFRVAIERIAGKPLDDGYETYAMRRGHELEPAARAEHEAQAGVIVWRAGIVLTDDGAFGASADGLIGQEEGSEYKCLISPDSLRPVLFDEDISTYIDQVQGCMWITGRKRWHFCMYCPALEPVGRQLFWRVIERNDEFIEALEADLIAFKALVDDYEHFLRNNPANAGLLLQAA
ncbi:YqaJ recombinase family protein [Hydrogenophaga intermedia]|uniref:YqaJ recombinase family protein n=1 Tax=Hydrogenophaga intermedia TaxID=65786 RepID=A0A1L1PKB7_HYDIT|nr:lambda exonuclease family protein [Hydrogenophaga intermedia]CDN87377.1 YqaJ recombinase family protein [Hydrogenophaga intermedia]